MESVSFFLVVSVLIATMPGTAKSDAVKKDKIFLYGGKPLSDYDGANSAEVRGRYLPVVAAYPSLVACAATDPDDIGSHFTISDLQFLPSVEAKEVCVFFELSGLETPQSIEDRIVKLGFHEARFSRYARGYYLQTDWNQEHGSILAPGLANAITNAVSRSWFIAVTLDSAGNVTSVRINGRSILNL